MKTSNIYYANTEKIINSSTGAFRSLLGLIKENKRVFVCLPDEIAPKIFSRCIAIYYPDIRIGYGTENDNSYNLSSQLIYVNCEHLQTKLFRYYSLNKKIDFADILIITNTNLENYHNLLLLSFLFLADESNLALPKIIVDLSMKIDRNFTSNDLDIAPQKKNLQAIINYDYKEDVFEKINRIISNDQFNNMIIYVPDLVTANYLQNKILTAFPKLLIIVIDNDSKEETLKQLLCSANKVIIASNIEVLPLTKINVVIDLMRTSRGITTDKFESLSKYAISTKANAERHINYLNINKCYRFVNRSTFNRLKDVPNKKIEISGTFLEKYNHQMIISFCQAGINPISAFDVILKCGNYSPIHLNTIREKILVDLNRMTKFEMLIKNNNTYSATSLSMFCKSIPLGYQNSCFLWKWMQTSYPIYPGIVLISFIHYNKNNCELFPYDKGNEQFLLEQLNSWNNFTEQLGAMHYYYISNYEIIKNKSPINRWIKDNNLTYIAFNKLIRKIHRIYNIVKGNYRVNSLDIKLFEADEIVQCSKALYRSIID